MPTDLKNIDETIPTPFLLVEEKIVENNIRRVHDYADRHDLAVRPHVKTHKSLFLARMQMAAGAVGIAVAKAQEAEVMAGLGSVDTTVAYPAIGPARVKILAELAREIPLRVAMDSRYAMEGLSRAAAAHGAEIGVVVIFDAGLHRCGEATPSAVAKLARLASDLPGLRYEGIQIYLGHLYGPAADAPESFEAVNRIWDPVMALLRDQGLAPETVSSGSTPSLFHTHRIHHANEIRVGTAYFNDYFVLKFGHCALEDCAARIIATVVSDVVPGQVIIDAGSKALSAKQLLRHENLEMGFVPEHPEARIFRLHEEHGWIDVSRCDNPPRTGDRIGIVPVNIALCFNLYNDFHLLSNQGKTTPHRVDARGCLS